MVLEFLKKSKAVGNKLEIFQVKSQATTEWIEALAVSPSAGIIVPLD